MFRAACVVNIGCRCHSGDTKGTGCGILIDSSRGYVLAHGSTLAPFLQKTSHISLPQNKQVSVEVNAFSCEVLLEMIPREQLRLNHFESVSYRSHLQVVETGVSQPWTVGRAVEETIPTQLYSRKAASSSLGRHPYTKFSGVVRDVFQCSSVHSSLTKLMPDSSWELIDRRDTKHSPNDNNNNVDSKDNNNNSINNQKLEENAQHLLSCFILIEIQNWTPYESALKVLPASLCHRGDLVEICSTPFAGLKPAAFMNSYSRGIISNLAGEDNCLILSDARCILGGEGAPLYTLSDERQSESCLTGMVIASLCWKNDEWVGFSVSCAVDKILDSLPPNFSHVRDKVKSVSDGSGTPGTDLSQGVLEKSPEVVLLKVGPTWGSGVVIDEVQGLILSCSHVIKDAHRYPVQMKASGEGGLQETDVIYRQQPLKHQFDLALVQSMDTQYLASHFKHSLSVARPKEGLEVFVIGHALFGSEHDLQPSVSAGVISKVISVSNVPVMIQTTCAVHPGASGGALVDRDGQLLGIVVCNARDNTSGASFPHINMSIPVSTVWPLILKYQRSGDVRYLQSLELKNLQVNNIWSLEQEKAASTSRVQRLPRKLSKL